jgi:plastocyanin
MFTREMMPSRWTPWAEVLAACLLAVASRLAPADDRNDPAAHGTGLVRVEGIVTYDGPLPEPIPVAEAATVRHPVEVDPATRGLKDAVVWLEGVPARAEPSPNKPPVAVDQRNFFFVPHVLAVDAGQEVQFLNSDNANHGVTAASLEPANCFNVVIPLAEGRYVHRFVASRHPVAIGCPIHSSMAAWVYVFEHPYHAVTDEQGGFRLPPVPAGQYTLEVRHADGGMRKQQAIEIRAGQLAQARIALHASDLKARAGEAHQQGGKRP